MNLWFLFIPRLRIVAVYRGSKVVSDVGFLGFHIATRSQVTATDVSRGPESSRCAGYNAKHWPSSIWRGRIVEKIRDANQAAIFVPQGQVLGSRHCQGRGHVHLRRGVANEEIDPQNHVDVGSELAYVFYQVDVVLPVFPVNVGIRPQAFRLVSLVVSALSPDSGSSWEFGALPIRRVEGCPGPAITRASWCSVFVLHQGAEVCVWVE